MLQIEAEGGRDHVAAVNPAFETGKDFGHLFDWHVDADEPVDPCRIEWNAAFCLVRIVHVDRTADHLSCAEQLYQLAGPLNRRDAGCGIKLLFKPSGSFGAHPKLFGSGADRRPVEAGGLKDDHIGIVNDAAILAAHHARNRGRFFCVGNREHIWSKCALHSVECHNRFSLGCAADDNLPALNKFMVKCVHRLAVLQHDIVGDVNNVIDRADTGSTQALAHPPRGRLNFDIFDHPRDVARAEVGCGDLYREIVVDVIHCIFDSWLGQVQRDIEGERRLPRKPGHRQAVGTVGCDLKFNTGII